MYKNCLFHIMKHFKVSVNSLMFILNIDLQILHTNIHVAKIF